jgi:nucleotide-binding universal stress UspA family protein
VELCVATDLSPAATSAVRLAFEWAARLGASVRLVHIVHDPELAPAFASDVPGDVEEAERQLEELASAAGVQCVVDVQTAEAVAAGILAASSKSDLLFVASQGKSLLQRLRLGSIATEVLRQSHIPVVCLPASA